MANIGLDKTVVVIVGLLVAGEALALLVGMILLSPRPNPWVTAANIFLVVLDIASGASMIVLAVMNGGGLWGGWILGTALVSLAAHAYREWDYFSSNTDGRFLSNLPLFVFNNVKLIGLIFIIGIRVSSFLATRF